LVPLFEPVLLLLLAVTCVPAVVDPRFCFPQQTVLIMQEQLGAFRNDNFSITDAAGRPFFNLQAASLSFSNSRQLLDVYNSPVLHMQKKMPSLRGSWLINRASDRVRVATVRPSTFSFTPCKRFSAVECRVGRQPDSRV
jgi:uncharacterized protein YxjI